MKRLFKKAAVIKKDERGQTLIIVLILVAVGCLIIAPLLSLIATGYTTTKNVYNQKNSELYAADAGVQNAIWKINYDSSSLPVTTGNSISLPSLNENGKPVSVTITNIGSDNNTINPNSRIYTYRIESAAGSTITYAIVKYTTAADAYAPEEEEEKGPLFNNAIAALNGNITVNAGGATITGDTYIGNNQMVINSWFNPINGNVYAAAGITGTRASQATLTSGHTITVNPGSPCLIPSPPPTYGVQTFDSALSTMTDLKNQVYTVTYNINTPVPSGTPTSSLTIKNKGSSSSYYVYSNPINVSGNMTLSNTNYVRFDGTVCVGGNLSISGDAHVIFNAGVKIDGQLTMTGGGGTVTFNDTLTAGSIDYANGMSLYLNNNVKVNGNVSFGTSGTTELKGTVYIGGNLSNTGARKLVSYKAMYINGNLSLTAGGYIEKSSDPPDATNKVIVVNGNITQSGGTTLGNINQYPLIINLTPGATITMNSGAKTNAALYAPSASVSLNGNAQFYGSLIAGSINLGNGSGSPGITWVSGLFSDITGGSSSGSGGSGGGSGGGTAYPAVEASRQIITWDIR